MAVASSASADSLAAEEAGASAFGGTSFDASQFVTADPGLAYDGITDISLDASPAVNLDALPTFDPSALDLPAFDPAALEVAVDPVAVDPGRIDAVSFDPATNAASPEAAFVPTSDGTLPGVDDWHGVPAPEGSSAGAVEPGWTPGGIADPVLLASEIETGIGGGLGDAVEQGGEVLHEAGQRDERRRSGYPGVEDISPIDPGGPHGPAIHPAPGSVIDPYGNVIQLEVEPVETDTSAAPRSRPPENPAPSLLDDPGVLVASLPGAPIDLGLSGNDGLLLASAEPVDVNAPTPQPAGLLQPVAPGDSTWDVNVLSESPYQLVYSPDLRQLVKVPQGWKPSEAETGYGVVFADPESPREIRIMDGEPSIVKGTRSHYPGGYVRVQDANYDYLRPDGRRGPVRLWDNGRRIIEPRGYTSGHTHVDYIYRGPVTWLDDLFATAQYERGPGGSEVDLDFSHTPPLGADPGVPPQQILTGTPGLVPDHTPPLGADPGVPPQQILTGAPGLVPPHTPPFDLEPAGGRVPREDYSSGVSVVDVERARVVVADGVQALRERGLSTAEGVVIDAGAASVSAVLNSVQGREWLRELGVSAAEVAAVLGVGYDPGAVGSALVGPALAQPVQPGVAGPGVAWEGSEVDPADLFGEQFARYGQGAPAPWVGVVPPAVVPQAEPGTPATGTPATGSLDGGTVDAGAVDAGALALFEAYGQLAGAADRGTVTVGEAPGAGQWVATQAGRISEQFTQDTLAYLDWLGRSFATENLAAANEEANQAWRDTPSQVTAAGGFLGIGNHTFTAVFGNDPAAVREGIYQVDPNNRQQALLVDGSGPAVVPTGVLRIVAAEQGTWTTIPATPAAPPTTTPITTPPAPLPLRIPATP